MSNIAHILFSEEVKKAKKNNIPIVALESTIITHGMPYPENRDTAKMLEDTVRKEGACPATIAILEGEIRVGLNANELDTLANSDKNEMLKVSTKDIPYAIIKKINGGTTVAATMHIANLVGIQVFATGGIGGVHRGAETSFDISADLEELARTPVAVVCAGAKSILDLSLTMEYLETKSIPVIGYQTNVLPAFYTRKSDCELDLSLDSPQEIAQFLETKWKLGEHIQKTGVVIANPIPEEHSLEKNYIDSIVEEALECCEDEEIRGKEITPYILAYIAEATDNISLDANIELVKNNALLAAKIVVEHKSLG